MADLSARQQRFVEEYVKDGNATRAYIDAGYTSVDADVAGPALLGISGIQEAIRMVGGIQRPPEATRDFVIGKLLDFANANATDAYEEDDRGELRLKRLSKIRVPVNKVSVRRNRHGEQEVSIQVPSQLQAVEALGRHLALFTDNVVTEVRLTEGDRDAKMARLRFLEEKVQARKAADEAGSGD